MGSIGDTNDRASEGARVGTSARDVATFSWVVNTTDKKNKMAAAAEETLQSTTATVGAPVELVTVHVHKRRWRRLGLELTVVDGDDERWPRVHTSRDARFLPQRDRIFMINGKEARGCRATAWRIYRKARMSITVIRC